MGYTHLGLLEYWWISYIRAVHYVCGTPFQISGNVSDIRNFFTRLGLAVLQKHSMMTAGWLPLNVFARCLCPMCVMGTWISSWDDVILIWYRYIVICTLVTILNWWFSSKDLKLQVMIKEALVVIHWLTFRIILLCSLSRGHGALFLIQQTTQELLLYMYKWSTTHRVLSRLSPQWLCGNSCNLLSLRDIIIILIAYYVNEVWKQYDVRCLARIWSCNFRPQNSVKIYAWLPKPKSTWKLVIKSFKLIFQSPPSSPLAYEFIKVL